MTVRRPAPRDHHPDSSDTACPERPKPAPVSPAASYECSATFTSLPIASPVSWTNVPITISLQSRESLSIRPMRRESACKHVARVCRLGGVGCGCVAVAVSFMRCACGAHACKVGQLVLWH
eukprot:scaffold115382_cov75-Phaeocystis_antarctica.AAC.3